MDTTFIAIQPAASGSLEVIKFIVEVLTLFTVIAYTYFTFRIMRDTRNSMRESLVPVLTIRAFLNEESIQQDSVGNVVDVDIRIHIQNRSRNHAFAKLRVNLIASGDQIIPVPLGDYQGERFWYIPALKWIEGHFNILPYLKDFAGKTGRSDEHDPTLLTKLLTGEVLIRVVMDIEYGNWSLRKSSSSNWPTKNPPERYRFKLIEAASPKTGLWLELVPEPTTHEIV